LFFNKLQIASVAALPRNDIMTQPLKRREGDLEGGKEEGDCSTNVKINGRTYNPMQDS